MEKEELEDKKFLVVTMDPETMTVTCTGSTVGLQFLQYKPAETDHNVSVLLKTFLEDHYKTTEVSIVEKHFDDIDSDVTKDQKLSDRSNSRKRKKVAIREAEILPDKKDVRVLDNLTKGRKSRSGRRIKIPKWLEGGDASKEINLEDDLFNEEVKSDYDKKGDKIDSGYIHEDIFTTNMENFDTVADIVDQNNMFDCRKCGVKIETEIDRVHHELMAHDFLAENFEVRSKELKCPICQTVRKSADTMKNHLQTHFETDPNDLTCKICNLQCVTKYRLRRHFMTHKEAEYPCNICGKKFRTEKLNHHMLEHQKKSVSLESLNQDLPGAFPAHMHDGKNESGTHGVTVDAEDKNIETMVIDPNETAADKVQDETTNEKVQDKNFHENPQVNKQIFIQSNQDDKIQVEHHESNESEKPPTEIYPCKYCPQKFSRKFNLTRHIVKKHKTRINVKVQTAPKDSGSEEVFKCSHCGEVSYSLIESVRHKLDAHDLVVLDSSDNTYKCPICKISRKNSGTLKLHLQEHFKIDIAELTCNICGIQCKTIPRLNNHKMIHNKAKYPCPLCGKKFRMMKYVRRHLNETNHTQNLSETKNGTAVVVKRKPVKQKVQSPGICDVCGKTFRHQSTMLIHRTIHFDEKNFSCPTCNKKFRVQSSLNNHMMIHSEAKDFVCEQCGKSFKISQGLRMHKLRHHDKVDYKCDFCDRRFLSFGGKKYHILKEHKDSAKNFGLKFYPCEHCNRVSSSYQEYLRHESSHVDNRSHVCEICNGRWATVSQLNVHKKSHFGLNKKFSCSICDFKTTTPWKLKRHLSSSKHHDNCQTAAHNAVSMTTNMASLKDRTDKMKTPLEKTYKSNMEESKSSMEINEVKDEGQRSSEIVDEVEVKYYEVPEQIILTEDNGVVYSVNGLDLEDGTYIYDASVNQAVESILKLKSS